jgi:hypothetical protein
MTVLGFALMCVTLSTWAYENRLVEVKLYDRTEGRMLPVYSSFGRDYVPGQPGNEYRIEIRNRTGQEVLAVPAVDGVNVITGETATPHQSGYVLGPWETMSVQGWRKSLDRTAAFYFTSPEDSYAGRTGRPDRLEEVEVAVFRSRSPYPAVDGDYSQRGDEPSRPSARAESQMAPSPSEKSLGTGHGRGEDSRARRVQFERATSYPEEVVVLHYDSYRNLQARGLVPRDIQPLHRYPPESSGFVPDPPSAWR